VNEERHLVDQPPPQQRPDQGDTADDVQVLARHLLQRPQHPAQIPLQHFGVRARDHRPGRDDQFANSIQRYDGLVVPGDGSGVLLERVPPEQYRLRAGHQLIHHSAGLPQP